MGLMERNNYDVNHIW